MLVELVDVVDVLDALLVDVEVVETDV